MTFLRKLEIVCGVTTALLGIAAAVQMFSMNLETSRELERSFSLVEEVLGALLMYILPGLLVAIGSYVHASRLRPWGLPMVIFSSLFLVIFFVVLVSNLAFYKPNLLFWLSFSFLLLAVTTMAISIIVGALKR
jgi:hypothetical protein